MAIPLLKTSLHALPMLLFCRLSDVYESDRIAVFPAVCNQGKSHDGPVSLRLGTFELTGAL